MWFLYNLNINLNRGMDMIGSWELGTHPSKSERS